MSRVTHCDFILALVLLLDCSRHVGTSNSFITSLARKSQDSTQ